MRRETNPKLPRGHGEGVRGAGGTCLGPGERGKEEGAPAGEPGSRTGGRTAIWDQEGAAG